MSFESYDAIEVTIVKDPTSLSNFELVGQYQNVSKCYLKQKELIDQYRQKIYTLEKEKALRDNVLQDELQSAIENYDQELDKVKKSCVVESKDLHNRLSKLNMTIEKLEQENECLKCELEKAHKQSQIIPNIEPKTNNKNETIVSNERIEYLLKIEAEHLELIDVYKSEKSQLLSQLLQTEKNLEEIKEYYECSEENLKFKTAELEDAKNIIDSMQEKMVNIENELASYKNGDIDHNKKGNSLFAEVDDQRQQMRELLHRQNQQYQMMKQKYNESHDEIHRLKRENADIHNEIKECVNMFKNADKFYKSKLNEHIGFLKTENSRLTEKLKQTQLEMDSLAKTQGVDWLSSMLEYCENETKELNLKLMSYGMKKCEAEGLYAQAQELAAKWRFEALKSRCIIMNREMLLENSNIKFEPKLPNIRQMVSKLFDANEEPRFYDEVLIPDDNQNELSSKSATDGSWTDVKEIFEAINKQVSSTGSSIQNQQKREENSLNSLSKEARKSQETTDFNKHNVGKCVDFEDKKLIENKENIGNMSANSSESCSQRTSRIPPGHITSLYRTIETKTPEKKIFSSTTQNCSSVSIINNEKSVPPTNDPENRVRLVNVEMFTVTLKRRDSPKEISK